jgi:hypothetical protein
LQTKQAHLQSSSVCNKDTKTGLIDMAQDILLAEEQNKASKHNLSLRVKERVDNMSCDTQILNDALYENYADFAHYSDEDFTKTAYFLDSLSRADEQE